MVSIHKSHEHAECDILRPTFFYFFKIRIGSLTNVELTFTFEISLQKNASTQTVNKLIFNR